MDPKHANTLITRLAVMGLKPGATFIDVQQQWKTLAPPLHPDRNPDPQAHAMFKRLSEAYRYLATYRDDLQYLPAYVQQPPPRPTPPPHPAPDTTDGSSKPVAYSTGQLRARWFEGATALVVFTVAFLIYESMAANHIVNNEFAVAQDFLDQARQERQSAEKLRDDAERAAQERKNTIPDRPLPPPMFESVFNPGFPSHEVELLTGASPEAIEHSIARLVDINDDGAFELLVTDAEGSCRQEGCPVFLFWRRRSHPSDPKATLRDVLPNNYGWTSLTITEHKTKGVRDIIFTASTLSMARTAAPTPAQRECHRLIWNDSAEQYAFDQKDPSADECLAAEKNTWNIANARERGARGFKANWREPQPEPD